MSMTARQYTYPPEILWIKANMDILNLKALAEKVGIPPRILWNFCHDIHTLNEKYWAKAVKQVRKIVKIGK